MYKKFVELLQKKQYNCLSSVKSDRRFTVNAFRLEDGQSYAKSK